MTSQLKVYEAETNISTLLRPNLCAIYPETRFPKAPDNDGKLAIQAVSSDVISTNRLPGFDMSSVEGAE